MRLHPGGLIGEQRIGGGVRFVEAVAGEFVDQIEQFVGLLGFDAGHRLAAVDEALALRVHLRLDLLAHGAAQQVGIAERIAREDLRGLHHLLLIDEDAVGFGENLLQLGVGIFDRHLARLALAEQRDVVHRTRPVERDQRDDVAEIGRLDRGQRAPHPFGFELEHADRVARFHQLVDRRIVELEQREVDRHATPFEQIGRLLEHRQRLETEKVELDQPARLDMLHVELGHRHVRARIAVERDQLRQRPVADHHARRMGRGIAREALELHRQIDQPLYLVVVLVFAAEIGRAVERARQRPGVGGMVGHHLAQPIDLAVAHLQDASGVAQHRARLQFAEGDDLRNVVVAVFVLDVADHLAAARFAKVDVEVGHRHAFGVEEALEQQAELDGIEIGDRQRPGDQAASARAAPRTHRNVLFLGPFDEIGNDQEVAGKAHLVDDPDLVIEPVEIDAPLLFAHRAIGHQPRLEPGAGIGGEHPRLALDIARQAGEDRRAVGRREGAALRDHQRVGDRFGQIGEAFLHHVRRFDEAFRIGAQPLLGIDMRRAGDAEHGVMRLVHMRLGVIGGVGGDQRQVARIGERDQRLLGGHLHRIAAAREFDIEPLGEQGLEPVEQDSGVAVLTLCQQPGHRPLARAGERDQPLGAALEILKQDMRLEFERAGEMRLADEMAQIVVAGLVLRIEREVIDLLAGRSVIPAAGDPEQRADDRLDAFVEAGLGEHDRAVEPVAIRQRDCGKAAFLGQFRHRLGLDRALEHGIGGEDAQRYEGGKTHAADMRCPGRLAKGAAGVFPASPARARPRRKP